jgi:hypothetical protein
MTSGIEVFSVWTSAGVPSHFNLLSQVSKLEGGVDEQILLAHPQDKAALAERAKSGSRRVDTIYTDGKICQHKPAPLLHSALTRNPFASRQSCSNNAGTRRINNTTVHLAAGKCLGKSAPRDGRHMEAENSERPPLEVQRRFRRERNR